MSAANVPEYRPVYRSLHRPLTVCGVDRRLFFLALLVGAVSGAGPENGRSVNLGRL
jgi:hypothetical protein